MRPVNSGLVSNGDIQIRNAYLYVSTSYDANRGIAVIYNDQDGASYGNYNGGLQSWYGIGFKCTTDSVTRFIFDTRTGNMANTGNINAGTLTVNSGSTLNGGLTVNGGITSNTYITTPGFRSTVYVEGSVNMWYTYNPFSNNTWSGSRGTYGMYMAVAMCIDNGNPYGAVAYVSPAANTAYHVYSNLAAFFFGGTTLYFQIRTQYNVETRFTYGFTIYALS
jgi:hypothetical protein